MIRMLRQREFVAAVAISEGEDTLDKVYLFFAKNNRSFRSIQEIAHEIKSLIASGCVTLDGDDIRSGRMAITDDGRRSIRATKQFYATLGNECDNAQHHQNPDARDELIR